MKEYDETGLPTLEYLRGKGRERLMTYFLGTNVPVPDDYEEMVVAARRICATESGTEEEWLEAIRNGPLIPIEDVLREFGIDLDEKQSNEPAA